jgi:hypothetical protein
MESASLTCSICLQGLQSPFTHEDRFSSRAMSEVHDAAHDLCNILNSSPDDEQINAKFMSFRLSTLQLTASYFCDHMQGEQKRRTP